MSLTELKHIHRNNPESVRAIEQLEKANRFWKAHVNANPLFWARVCANVQHDLAQRESEED